MSQFFKSKFFCLPRKAYHHLLWTFYNILTLGKVGETYSINPNSIQFGQLPTNQFPRRAQRFNCPGDWDLSLIAIKEHTVYSSLFERFKCKAPWEKTKYYKFAVEKIRSGHEFRGYRTINQVDAYFSNCDTLYDNIKSDGYKSNYCLYKSNRIINPCKRLDEVTVNLSRLGMPILNDGWHRFSIALIQNIPSIPVRILAKHTSYGSWVPADSHQKQINSEAQSTAGNHFNQQK